MRSINIKFPLKDDTQNNVFLKTNKSTKEAFTSNLLFLLMTKKGEYFYNPDFGTNLLKHIFEPSDDITIKDIQNELNDDVTKYIPNLTINDVRFNWVDSKENNFEGRGGSEQLNLKIKFLYEEDAFSEEGEIDLTF